MIYFFKDRSFRSYENLLRRWRHLRGFAAAGSGDPKPYFGGGGNCSGSLLTAAASGGMKNYFGGGGTCSGSLRLVPEARKTISEVEALAADRGRLVVDCTAPGR